MSDTALKQCTRCGIIKPSADFPRNKRCTSGTISKCRTCKSDLAKQARLGQNRQAILEKEAKWRELNRDKKAINNKKWVAANPDKVHEQRRRWREQNPDATVRSSLKAREQLARSYVARRLGLAIADAPPEMIDLKREQLQIHRLTKELNEALTEATKGEPK